MSVRALFYIYWIPTHSFISLKGKLESRVAEKLFACRHSDITIPAIVLFELEVGIAKSNSPLHRKAQLQELTTVIRVIPFGEYEAQCAAAIRAYLEKKGQPIGPFDTLIADTAVAHHATVVTRNTREFSRVNNLSPGACRNAASPRMSTLLRKI